MPRHLIASALALAALPGGSLLLACSTPDFASCAITCGDEGACPDGTSCGSDGYCYAPDEPAGSCSSPGGSDSSVIGEEDAAIIDEPDGAPDAGTDRPDAATDRPDAAVEPDGDVVDPPDACAGAETFGSEVVGPIAIPDNNDFGVSTIITAVLPCATVESVQVRVDITHTFRGDLQIALTSPAGAEVVLLPFSNDPGDDVHQTFDAVIAIGEDGGGDWVLTVIDDTVQDAGTLDRWSLGLNRVAP